jgi:hypothetical protein
MFIVFSLAGFFFRDPGSLVGLPEVAKDNFVCQSSQKRLQLLKHKLRERFPVGVASGLDPCFHVICFPS